MTAIDKREYNLSWENLHVLFFPNIIYIITTHMECQSSQKDEHRLNQNQNAIHL